jgi:hypothetical protein
MLVLILVPISAMILGREYKNNTVNSYWHGKCPVVSILDLTVHKGFTAAENISIWPILRYMALQ